MKLLLGRDKKHFLNGTIDDVSAELLKKVIEPVRTQVTIESILFRITVGEKIETFTPDSDPSFRNQNWTIRTQSKIIHKWCQAQESAWKQVTITVDIIQSDGR